MRASSHKPLVEAKPREAMARLQDFLARRRFAKRPVEGLEALERELHGLFAATEGEVLTEQGGRTMLMNTVLYASREARDAALRTGMEEDVAAGYDRLAALLAGRRDPLWTKGVCP